MGTVFLLGGVVGAVAGVAGAIVAEGVFLGLRRRRNALLVAAGELPWKDEVFRPMWLLLGTMGMIAGAVARGLEASFGVAIAAALAPPVLLIALGLWFLRPRAR